MRFGEYTQQLDHLKISLDDLPDLLNKKPLEEWAYIVHDKDIDKVPHIHVMMHFSSDQTPENVSKWFHDEPQYIQKSKSRRYPWNNMLSYMIHNTESSRDKWQYDASEVVASFDYVAVMENITEIVTSKNEHVREVLGKIMNNEIPRLRIGEYLSDFEQLDNNYAIDKAYKIRDNNVIRNNDRDLLTIWISGPSGCGKSTYAKMYAHEHNMLACVSGSENDPLETYRGQECLILDDFRANQWKFSEFLKLIDPHINSLVGSRYFNKNIADCRLVFITSVITPFEAYSNMIQSCENREPIRQLFRRIPLWIELTDTTLVIRKWNGDSSYDIVESNANPVPLYIEREIKQRNYRDDIQNLIAFNSLIAGPSSLSDLPDLIGV